MTPAYALLTMLLTVPPLPSPPAWEVWLFERPLLGGGLLVAAAVIALIVAGPRARVRTTLGVAGLLLVAAGCVAGAGLLVETERETLQARSRTFVGAVAEAETQEAERLLADDVQVRFGGIVEPSFSRETILNLISAFDGRLSLREWSVGESEAIVERDARARTRVRVRVVPEQTAFPTTSLWQLDWRRGPDGRWRISAVEALLFNGRRPGASLASAIRRYL